MRKQEIYLRLTLYIIIIALFVAAAYIFPIRIDLTRDQRYSLSTTTRTILEQLTSPITITAYFTEDLPPNLALVRQDILFLLDEYAIAANGKVRYQIVNPNESPEKERQAQMEGITPLIVSVREKDQMKQMKAYLGLVLHYQNRKEVLPIVPLDGSYEYALTRAIKKLTQTHKIPIAYLQGHGEPPLDQMRTLRTELEIFYRIHTISLNDIANLPTLDTFATLLWVQPTDSLPTPILQHIEQYLKKGGKLCLLYDALNASLQSQFIQLRPTKLHKWLRNTFGVEIEPRILLDAQCGQVLVQQQRGIFMFQVPINFPYFPVITEFADHPITRGLDQVFLYFASPVSRVRPPLRFTPLAMSSPYSAVENPPVFVDIQREWKQEDFPLQNLPVAALVEDTTTGMAMVLIGDGDLTTEQNNQPPVPANIAFVVNAIEWLTDAQGLAALRTKVIRAYPLKQISDSKKQMIKVLNVSLPVFLVILLGLTWYFLRQRQRRQWQAGEIH